MGHAAVCLELRLEAQLNQKLMAPFAPRIGHNLVRVPYRDIGVVFLLYELVPS